MSKTFCYGGSQSVPYEDCEGGIMPDIEYFYELVMQIKKANRKYLSNFYLNESVWAEAINQGNVEYRYKKREYLNLWWRKEHFRRLYYYIADPCHYEVADSPMTSVCDVICKGSGLEEICRMLSDTGMARYAVYEKWTRKNGEAPDPHSKGDLQVIAEDDGRIFSDKLHIYFDELSDLLPEREEMDQFIREKHFIGVHNRYDGRLVAGIVYSKRGSVITEEFIFVTEDYRGLGISRLLHDTLYRKYMDEDVRYTAWIRKDNLESARLHHTYNYEKQNQFKITYIKK